MTAPSAPPSGRFPVPVLIAGVTIAATPLVAFSGFPRFDVPQTALLVAGTGLVAVASAFEPASAAAIRAHRVALWLLTAALAWVGASVFWGGSIALADATAGASAWIAMGALALLLARYRSRFNAQTAAPIVLALPVLAAVGASIAQRMGYDVPPAVPGVTVAGVRGWMDDPQAAATWAMLALGALAVAPASGSRTPTALHAALCIAAAVAGGLTGQFTIVIAAALALLVGAGVLLARGTELRRLLPATAAVLVAAGLTLVSAAPADGPVETPVEDGSGASADEPLLLDDGPAFPSLMLGTAYPVASAAHESLVRRLTWDYAAGSVWTGHGPAGFTLEANAYLDTSDPVALRSNWGQPVLWRAPLPLLQWAGDYGWPLVALLIAALGLLMVPRRESDAGAGVGVEDLAGAAVLVAMLLVGNGIQTGAGAALAAWLIAALVRSETAPAQTASAAIVRVPPGLLIAAALMLSLAWFHIQSLRWGLEAARGVQFMSNAIVEPGAAAFERASAFQKRFESELNAGIAAVWNTTESRDELGAIHHLQSAGRMSPASATARYELANHYIRSASNLLPGGPQAIDESKRQVFDLLVRVRQLDPNHVEAALLLSQAYLVDEQTGEAIAVLESLRDRALPPAARLAVLVELGAIYADVVDEPRLALPLFEDAIELAATVAMRRQVNQYINLLRTWIETGARPAIGDSPAAGEEGHEEGHDEGHEGHEEGSGGHDATEGLDQLYLNAPAPGEGSAAPTDGSAAAGQGSGAPAAGSGAGSGSGEGAP
jgi:hypothetical protein